MASNREAVLRGVQQAAKLHGTLNTRERITAGETHPNVLRAISTCRIPAVFRPLDNVLGVYIREPYPGILVTTQRPLSVQRFTAAHELGHHLLGHKPNVDDDSMLRRSPFAPQPRYGAQEIEADSFASEFLMPKWLLVHHFKAQEWMPEDLHQPENIYQLALRLGTSYTATCQALRRYRVLDAKTYKQVSAVRPSTIKRRLLQGFEPESGWSDVWVLTDKDHLSMLEGSRSDIFIIQMQEHAAAGFLWDFDEVNASDLATVRDARESLNPECFGASVSRSIIVQSMERHSGGMKLAERRPWLADGEPAAEFQVAYDLNGPETEGLSRAERDEVIGNAD